MKQQRGIALITALLVTAIATISAVSMMSRQHLDLRRSSNIYAADQAWLFAQGVESWAVQIMERDRKDNDYDHLGEDWATVLPPIIVEGGTVAGKIEDLQGRFNLNNLVKDGVANELYIKMLKRLFDTLNVDNKPVQAIVDWLDKDDDAAFPDGAEDNVYLGREQAYRTANRFMTSVSELLLIEGIEFEDYQKLRPFLSALPVQTGINVNTASVEVLQALIFDLSAEDAKQLVDEREDAPFESIDAFRQHSLVSTHLNTQRNPDDDEEEAAAKKAAEKESMTVSSRYFLLLSIAQYGLAEIRLSSVIARDDAGVQVIMHGQGDY